MSLKLAQVAPCAPTPWAALRFAASPTKETAAEMLQAYQLEPSTPTLVQLILMGQPLELTEGGAHESNLEPNGVGGYKVASPGTHYVFFLKDYVDRAHMLLPLFSGAVVRHPASTPGRLVLAKYG